MCVKAIKRFFKNIKREQQIKNEIKAIDEMKGLTTAQRLAKKSCEWVYLLWNGNKEKFLIHKTSWQELLMCGRFPNVCFSMLNKLSESLDTDELETNKVDYVRLREEEKEFLIELAERSMVNPTYRECYDEILKLRGLEGSDVADVIPQDFLNDLLLWYVTDWEKNLKKNLEKSSLKDLEGLRNIGEKHHTNT